jgi:hypothetical protein
MDMESERQKYLRRIFELVEGRRQPGFGIVISLSDEKEKRAARALLKQRRRPKLPEPGGGGSSHDDDEE